MRLITLPGVFKPHSDSWALADLLGEYVNPGDSVLDLCTGSGVLAVAAALAGAGDVTAVDVSRRAAARRAPGTPATTGEPCSTASAPMHRGICARVGRCCSCTRRYAASSALCVQ